jgi:hypothetical protein
MIFEPAERVLLPTKDLLSFIFDAPPYDQEKPVRPAFSKTCYLDQFPKILADSSLRFTLTLRTLRVRFPATKLEN